MRYIFGYLLITLLASQHLAAPVAAAAEAAPCEHAATELRCVKFLHNYDADTITVQIPGVHPLLGDKISVRVLGVDTAEMRGRQNCEKSAAIAARDYVRGLLQSARRIDLVNVQRDKYFRVLADVVVDGTSLAKQLLAQRHAYAYDGGTKSKVDWCAFAH